MSPASHLVQILLPTRMGNGQPVTQARFEELLQELTNKFGGVTSFVRAPGQGLWNSGGDVERDNIAVIEVMTDEIDPPFWEAFRRKLERELAQQEIVIRAQQVNRSEVWNKASPRSIGVRCRANSRSIKHRLAFLISRLPRLR